MPPRVSAVVRRRQLLDEAARQFAARGFHGGSMQVIAERSGVTKPVLYQHFRNKEALYHEVVHDAGDRLAAAILEATSTDAGPRAQVEAGFAAYFGFVDQHPDAFITLFGSDARRLPELTDAVAEVEREMAEAIAGLIDAGLDEQHRRMLAHGIVGLGESVGRRWLAGGRVPGSAVVAAQVADLAWSGLRRVHPRVDQGAQRAS